MRQDLNDFMISFSAKDFDRVEISISMIVCFNIHMKKPFTFKRNYRLFIFRTSVSHVHSFPLERCVSPFGRMCSVCLCPCALVKMLTDRCLKGNVKSRTENRYGGGALSRC